MSALKNCCGRLPIVLALILFGCAPSALPDCEDPEIQATVLELVSESIQRDAAGLPEEVRRQLREKIVTELEHARTLARPASGDEVQCACTVVQRYVTDTPNPNWRGPPPEQRIPLVYRLSYTDRGEVWVEVLQ